MCSQYLSFGSFTFILLGLVFSFCYRYRQCLLFSGSSTIGIALVSSQAYGFCHRCYRHYGDGWRYACTVPLTKLVALVGWRQAVQNVGILGFAMLIVMYFWIKERPQVAERKAGKSIDVASAAKKAYLNTQYLRAAVYASLMNMAIAVFGAMMGTLYLEQRLEIGAEQAAMVNSMLFLGAIVGSPLVGWISDKMGLRVLPMKIGVFASLLTLIAILYLPVLQYDVFIIFLARFIHLSPSD